MQSFYTFLALDLARERAADAEAHQRADLARAARISQPSVLRRTLAHSLAAVSRGSAAVTRRLHDCIADDPARRPPPREWAARHDDAKRRPREPRHSGGLVGSGSDRPLH